MRAIGAIGGASLLALSLALTPVVANPGKDRPRPAPSLSNGSFTPAVADPRLAAALASRGVQGGAFRLTPSAAASSERGKQVRVAVRARASTPAQATRTASVATETVAPDALSSVTPSSYNLGVSVGWRRFALTGDVGEVQGGVLPGRRETAQVGLSYSPTRRITGRIQVGAEQAEGLQRMIVPDSSYSFDLGGSYSISRGIDVTGGVRYRIQHDRLEPLADDRRDSQAVYVGTAIRF